MTLTRQAYAHVKYPWEYTTAELSSLFGISRTFEIFQVENDLQDSGWVEALKMLEQQLLLLSIVSGNRNGSITSGSLDCLYSTDPTYPSYAATCTPSIADSVKTWIDEIRYQYGLSAWVWSSNFSAGRATLITAQIMEMWYATGLVHEATTAHTHWPCSGSTGLPLDPESEYFDPFFWIHNFGDPASVIDQGENYGSEPSYAVTKLAAGFHESSRIAGVDSILLFRHGGGDYSSHTGNGSLTVYYGVDTTPQEDEFDYPTSFYTGTLIDASFASVADQTTTGADGSYQYLDLTGIHPESGSGSYYYRIQMADHVTLDASEIYTTLTTGLKPCLWQVVTSNPY